MFEISSLPMNRPELTSRARSDLTPRPRVHESQTSRNESKWRTKGEGEVGVPFASRSDHQPRVTRG